MCCKFIAYFYLEITIKLTLEKYENKNALVMHAET